MFELTSYVGLFLAAFGAATLLPMQSEAVLVGMLLTDRYVASTLLAVATFGNVLGSTLNWMLGRSIERLRHKRWFPVRESKLEKAQQSYLRFGHWSLLLSWVPIIGDPLTVVAGVMREPFWSFLLIVTLAKGVRYLVLMAVTLGWA
ncbi:YqaA family protein [Pseudomonas migulae]|uniref:Membrane protein YqaA, SNARE-associated domain n=1 Tax=Pseudomonas migulae TaxID=78543 RepID=A0A1H5NLN2_9PSED|nr:YqaA family protein [Pseudomonas migulae]SEF02559.1 membrane protein YqaA, SNARE-associated domain [Pseudomonas migulae]